MERYEILGAMGLVSGVLFVLVLCALPYIIRAYRQAHTWYKTNSYRRLARKTKNLHLTQFWEYSVSAKLYQSQVNRITTLNAQKNMILNHCRYALSDSRYAAEKEAYSRLDAESKIQALILIRMTPPTDIDGIAFFFALPDDIFRHIMAYVGGSLAFICTCKSAKMLLKASP